MGTKPFDSHLGRPDKMGRSMRRLIALALVGVAAHAPPAAMQPPTPDASRIAALERELAGYRRMVSDWAGLTRYGSENSELGPPAAGEQRFFFQAEDGIRDYKVTGVQTCALPI